MSEQVFVKFQQVQVHTWTEVIRLYCFLLVFPLFFRPGYESVQTPRIHPPAVSSSPTNIQATPPISAAGGSGSNSPDPTTPFPPNSSSSTSTGHTGLTRVASTRGSPTQEQLTEPSVGMGGASSSAAQSGSSSTGGGGGGTNAQNADSSHSSRPQSGNSSNLPSRNGSIIQQRRERRVIIGAPLTRQQHYLSRNYLHHDLQLPDGYGQYICVCVCVCERERERESMLCTCMNKLWVLHWAWVHAVYVWWSAQVLW